MDDSQGVGALAVGDLRNYPLNNNNNNRNNSNSSNNNRRRGRGNNNGRPSGGGQQINRIDSRARGNAPQMLEKYRKMALDSHMNGDRVNEEYYLQFADHYFRVIADTRVRQEESRQPRDERWQEGRTETGGERDFGDYGSDDAVDPYDDLRQGGDSRQSQESRQGGDARADTRQGERPAGGERQGGERQGGERQGGGERYERQDRPERQERPERTDRADGQDRDRGERPPRRERSERAPRVEQTPVAAIPEDSEQAIATPSVEADTRSVYEPPENPFVRGEGRGGLKQRRPRRETRDETPAQQAADASLADDNAAANGPDAAELSKLDVFDPTILPPAVGTRRAAEVEPTDAAPDVEAEAKPRRRARRPRPAADGSDETLQVVS